MVVVASCSGGGECFLGRGLREGWRILIVAEKLCGVRVFPHVDNGRAHPHFLGFLQAPAQVLQLVP
jgi:hypothetical protein